MQVRFPSGIPMPVAPVASKPVAFQGKFTPDDQVKEVLKALAQDGSADAQFNYAMYLYDHKVPRWAKFKVNVLAPATMNFMVLIPPLMKVRNLPDDVIECYKWFYLAKRKAGEIGPNRISSWMLPLDLMMPKKDVNEAIRRAHVWLAEFEPGHRGGSYVDEVQALVARYKEQQGQ